jgi:D-alanyl-D-alanine carboxypeptidase (penicillin-binding protein 5/6)
VSCVYAVETAGNQGAGSDMAPGNMPLAVDDQHRSLVTTSAPGSGSRDTRAERIFAGSGALEGVRIHSENAILIDAENGEILFEQSGAERMYPASMTKIMTAIVALEHIENPAEQVVLSESVFQAVQGKNAAMAGFLPGESVRAVDLLYGLILPSGAECAVSLAEHTAGSESAFAEWMNDKARELGMNDTHFTNATGLHDEGHYSTVADIAILLRYALAQDAFYEMITSTWYSTPPTNLHENGVTFESTLFSAIDSYAFDGGAILGGKTGFTEEAGQCLASFAEKDGRRYILVTAGAPKVDQTQNLHTYDAFAIYDAI